MGVFVDSFQQTVHKGIWALLHAAQGGGEVSEGKSSNSRQGGVPGGTGIQQELPEARKWHTLIIMRSNWV